MPNFASPFSEPLNGRKLTTEELIRAIRFVIAAEYEAAQMYMQIVEATDNELVKKVLTSVTDEERVHAGEFLKVLHELAP
ncbi:MAG: ferritin family protein, partial [Candidatus Paceibacterota bacterium]